MELFILRSAKEKKYFLNDKKVLNIIEVRPLLYGRLFIGVGPLL